MPTPRSLIAAALAVSTSLPALGADAPLAFPEIALTPQPGALRIEGFVAGSGGGSATATLSIVHRGSGGSTTTHQTREVPLDGTARSRIAATTINVGPQSVLTVDLTVTQGDTVIAAARTTVGAPSSAER